ncbi:hypothetical protein [Streptomyces sp. cmx-10-25]|uniref:phage tail protein n=1 Tax=Streptomyces sp. cmx-10-25 TaxID=2790919 RepID=UPI0039807B75
MALTVGELNAVLSIDDRTVDPALRRAEQAMRAAGEEIAHSADDAARAAGDSLADGIGDGAEEAGNRVRSVGVALGGLAAGLPAVAAVTAAGLGMVAAFASAQAAVKAFQLAAGPQMESITEVAELAAQAEEAAAKGGKEAAAAQKAYADAMADLPAPTRAAAKEFIALKNDHQKWSDSMAGTTMPVYTKALGLLRQALPLLTPLVKAAARAFSGFLDEIGKGLSGGGIKAFADSLARFAEQNLGAFLRALRNIAVGFGGLVAAFLPMSGDMSGGLEDMTAKFAAWGQSLEGSAGFAQFVQLAGQGADTLGTLASAVGTLLVAAAPLIGVTSQLALMLAQVINAVPIGVLTALGTALVAVKVGMMAYGAGAAAVAAANRIMATSTWTAIAGWTRMMGVGLMAYVRIAAAAVVSAATTAAAWAGAALRSMATFAVQMVRTAAVAVAQFALMAGRAIVWAATMAAQWLIAMGPVGWIIAAVIGLAALIIANWDKIKQFTIKAWDLVWSKIKAIGGFILDYFFGWKLVSYFLAHWDRIKSGVATKAGALLAWFKGLPGRLASALGNLGSLLYDKGMNVVQGLWNGISSMGGWIRDKIVGWAKASIPGPIADALGIHSPSKVTKAQGQWIARGLVVGLTGSSKQVQAAATKLADIVRDSMKPGKKRNAALKVIGKGTSQLLALANAEAKLAGRMKAANQRLADLTKARAELAGKVKEGILDAANITQGTENGVTATSILAGLNSQLQRAKEFAANLATLRKKGVRADLIAQIAEAGVEQGSATAAALANASSGQIQQINSTQKQLVDAAGRAGATAGDAMYGTGIRAAQGLVRGLQSQQHLIERQMLSIAKAMEKAIKKALGIKSPSRVMAAVGQYIPAGLVRGIEAGRSAVDKTMSSLVTPPSTLTAPEMYGTGRGAYGRQAAAPQINVTFQSSGTPRGDYVVDLLRDAVRKRGGDVQIVLGQRR